MKQIQQIYGVVGCLWSIEDRKWCLPTWEPAMEPSSPWGARTTFLKPRNKKWTEARNLSWARVEPRFTWNYVSITIESATWRTQRKLIEVQEGSCNGRASSSGIDSKVESSFPCIIVLLAAFSKDFSLMCERKKPNRDKTTHCLESYSGLLPHHRLNYNRILPKDLHQRPGDLYSTLRRSRQLVLITPQEH